MTTKFTDAGDVRVTVQAACGNSVLQDSRLVRVLGELSRLPAQASVDGTWLQRACSFLGGSLGCRVWVDSGPVTVYVALLKCSRRSDSSFPLPPK